jgi:hypothetical protein
LEKTVVLFLQLIDSEEALWIIRDTAQVKLLSIDSMDQRADREDQVTSTGEGYSWMRITT